MTKYIEKVDTANMADEATRIIDNLKTGVNPEQVVCMMGIVITHSPDNPVDDTGTPMVQVQHFVLGDPDDIRKMMLFMLENSFEAPDEADTNDDAERVH